MWLASYPGFQGTDDEDPEMPTVVGQSPPGGSPVSEVSGEGGPWSVSIGFYPPGFTTTI